MDEQIKPAPVQFQFNFNPDAWDDEVPRNAEGVKLCKVSDPDCEACQ